MARSTAKTFATANTCANPICTDCCCVYTVTLVGGGMDGIFEVTREMPCLWQGDDNNKIQLVLDGGVYYWELSINYNGHFAAWRHGCNTCPRETVIAWTLNRYTYSTAPTITLIERNVWFEDCGLHSRTPPPYPPCTLNPGVQGSVDGYEFLWDLSDRFLSSSSSSYPYYVTFNTHASPDRLVVRRADENGVVLYDSGCIGTNRDKYDTFNVNTPEDELLWVRVYSNCTGFSEESGWSFNIDCTPPSSSSIGSGTCDLCCETYTITANSGPLAGTYVLTKTPSSCSWSGAGSAENTWGSIYASNGYWWIQLFSLDCVQYSRSVRSTATLGCPPEASWLNFSGQCATTGPLFIERSDCSTEALVISFDWNSARADLNPRINYTDEYDEYMGVNCVEEAPFPDYSTYSLEDTSLGGNETFTIYLDRAYADNQWIGSVVIPLYACWSSDLNPGESWGYDLNIEWRGIKSSNPCNTSTLSAYCCPNQIGSIEAFADGTYQLTLDCHTNPTPGCPTSCTSLNTYTMTITGSPATICEGSWVMVRESGNYNWRTDYNAGQSASGSPGSAPNVTAEMSITCDGTYWRLKIENATLYYLEYEANVANWDCPPTDLADWTLVHDPCGGTHLLSAV